MSLSQYEREVRVLLNGELGLQFARPLAFRFTLTSGNLPTDLAVGDLDGDECPEVFAGYTGTVVVLRGLGCEQ